MFCPYGIYGEDTQVRAHKMLRESQFPQHQNGIIVTQVAVSDRPGLHQIYLSWLVHALVLLWVIDVPVCPQVAELWIPASAGMTDLDMASNPQQF